MKCDSFEHDEMMQYQNTKIKQKKNKKNTTQPNCCHSGHWPDLIAGSDS